MNEMRYFPEALRAAVAELDLLQQEFADKVGISVALLTKIFRGELVHRKSLRLLLNFFRKPDQGERGQKIAHQLITAYLQDAFEEFGVPEEEAEEIDLKPELLTKRQRTVLSLFESIPGSVLAALHCLGAPAKTDIPLRDTLFSMADMVNSQHKSGFPSGYFRRGIEKPAVKKADQGRSFPDMLGGSMGEIIAILAQEK